MTTLMTHAEFKKRVYDIIQHAENANVKKREAADLADLLRSIDIDIPQWWVLEMCFEIERGEDYGESHYGDGIRGHTEKSG